MKKRLLASTLVALLIGGSSYLATGQYLFAIAVFLICFAVSVFIYFPLLENGKVASILRHECYLFIHRFLITLSVTTSLDKSLEAASEGMGPSFHRLNDDNNVKSAREKVEYYSSYFNSDLYKMFLSILDLYLDRGGDVLNLSSELLQEASRLEETELTYEKEARGRMVNYFLLWLMAMAIVSFLRFGLSNFFDAMKVSPIYLSTMGLFYFFLLGSTYVFLRLYAGKSALTLFRRKKKNG